MFMVRLMYLASDPLLVSGSVILGLHEALTPLSIMAGGESTQLPLHDLLSLS